MTYNNLPVYIDNPIASLGDFGFLLADSVSVSHETSLAPNKNKKTYRQNNPLAAKISINAVFHEDIPEFEDNASFNSYGFLSDSLTNTGDIGFQIKVGDNVFADCYIDQYSIEVSPFLPVTLKAEFSSYDPATGELISGDYSPPNPIMNSDNIIYGHTCELSGSLGPVTYTKINYSKRYQRTPVYTLGSINSANQLVDGVEAEMQVDSTGLSSLVPFSGEELAEDFGVVLKNIGGDQMSSIPSIIINSGATISSHSYSSQGGGSLSTATTIKEIIL